MKPRVSVALPTWKNGNILWLPLNGLIRQTTTYEWELIVMECETDHKDYINKYRKRLTDAGCVNVTYIHSPYRMPLAIKWKQMAEVAKGDIFLLQASDDFPPPERIQRTVNAFDRGVDWYQMRYHYHYSFAYGKLIKFDMLSVRGWLATGFNMAAKTADIRKVPESTQPNGIDTYLFNSIKPVNVMNDEVDPAGGVATDGMNTISTKRFNYYINTKPPFQKTEHTIHDIGLPPCVAKRLSETIVQEEMGRKFKLTGRMCYVVFTRNFRGRRAGHEYYVDEAVRAYLEHRGVVNRKQTETTQIETL